MLAPRTLLSGISLRRVSNIIKKIPVYIHIDYIPRIIYIMARASLCFTTPFHYSDVIISAVASRLIAQPFVQWQIKENIKVPRHWPLWGEIHQWPLDSPHKGPLTRKIFLYLSRHAQGQFTRIPPGYFTDIGTRTRFSFYQKINLKYAWEPFTWCRNKTKRDLMYIIVYESPDRK